MSQARKMKGEPPVPDEPTMQRFIWMGQESLSPDKYETLLGICADLCAARTDGLRTDSVQRCLNGDCAPLSPIQYKIIGELSRAVLELGAAHTLLSLLGSWGDTLSEETLLDMLKEYNELAEQDPDYTCPACNARDTRYLSEDLGGCRCTCWQIAAAANRRIKK